MKKYEYKSIEKVVDFNYLNLELGQTGWELVAVDEKFYYFKREKQIDHKQLLNESYKLKG